MVKDIAEAELSDEDKEQVEKLSFFWNEEYDCWISYRFGCAYFIEKIHIYYLKIKKNVIIMYLNYQGFLMKKISLYYKDGSSDKEYHAQIENKDNLFIVNFQYGRRGSTLTTGTKTKDPIELTKAEKVFSTLVKEKMSKGYSEGESGVVYQSVSLDERITGITPSLLNDIKNEEELEAKLKDCNWFLQQKYDGRALLVKKAETTVAINKKGLSISIPQSVIDLIERVPEQIITHGEIVGEKYYIFDMLEFNKEDLRSKPAKVRYELLKMIPELKDFVVPAFFIEEDKRRYFEEMKATKKEGVVLKENNSKYVPGRPASGGSQLKYKFWESATVEVIKQHKSKRSVTVAVYDGQKQIDMGNVTIPANYEIPAIGSLVEVIYLYCHNGEKGKLYQSKYKGIRDDQYLSDCTYSQIKFKSLEDVDEDDAENE